MPPKSLVVSTVCRAEISLSSAQRRCLKGTAFNKMSHDAGSTARGCRQTPTFDELVLSLMMRMEGITDRFAIGAIASACRVFHVGFILMRGRDADFRPQNRYKVTREADPDRDSTEGLFRCERSDYRFAELKPVEP